MVAQFPWLTAIIFLPLMAALAIPLIPDKEGKTVRWYALSVGIADLILMVYAFWNNYNPSNAQFQLTENYSWIPQLGISWSVSVDGISAPPGFTCGICNDSSDVYRLGRLIENPVCFTF